MIPAIPVVAGLALLTGGILLRLRAMSIQKKGTGGAKGVPLAPTAGTSAFDKPIIQPSSAVSAALATSDISAAQTTAKANPVSVDKVAEAAASAGVTVAELEAAVRFMDPNVTAAQFVAMGVTPRDIVDAVAQMRAASAVTVQAAAPPKRAIVNTNDPAPAGDLIVRPRPDGTADKIGGVDKGGTVIILDESDPEFTRIDWAGGRWPAVSGFVRSKFLVKI